MNNLANLNIIKPDSIFIQECIDAHDHYRQPLGMPSLVWDEELWVEASDWCTNLASNNLGVVHSHKKGLGENIAKRTTNSYISVSDMIITQWGDNEKPYFIYGPYNRSSNKDKTGKKQIGHYLQIVWRNTTNFACCVTQNIKTKQTYLVANYTPRGNIINQYPY